MVYNRVMEKTQKVYQTAQAVQYTWHEDTYYIDPLDALVIDTRYVGTPLNEYWDAVFDGQEPEPVMGTVAEVVVQKIVHRWTDERNSPDEFELYGTWLQGDIAADADQLKANADNNQYERIDLGVDFSLWIANEYEITH